MGSVESMFSIECTEMTGGKFGDMVDLQLRTGFRQGASNDLFDLARVQIDAWPESGHLSNMGVGAC